MKLNIFRISTAKVGPLKARLVEAKLGVIKEVEHSDWQGSFYYSEEPAPTSIPWAKTYAGYFPDGARPTNRNYFAAFVFEKDDECFALSYGKSHFYIRSYCDHDFGTELAKRIADESDIRQTAGKRFAGKRTKNIKSYGPQTPLIVEGGGSVDFIQASIIEAVVDELNRDIRFTLPRSVVVTGEDEIAGDQLASIRANLAAGTATLRRRRL